MTPPSFAYLKELVRRRTAIAIEDEKAYLVEARLRPIADREEHGDIESLLVALQRTPEGRLHEEVVDAMTTNETSFFRDLHPFTALRDRVIPALVRARHVRRRLRIWSAACSTGQEPYSIAILIREAFPELADWDIEIFATDISRRVLAQAREGRYSKLEINRGLPARMLLQHFEPCGLFWTLRKEVREMVRFEPLNLAGCWQLPEMDVVFLRNVMIYFEAPTKRAILARVSRTLAPDGVLFLGGAETTLRISDDFERETHDKATLYRPRGSAPGSPPL